MSIYVVVLWTFIVDYYKCKVDLDYCKKKFDILDYCKKNAVDLWLKIKLQEVLQCLPKDKYMETCLFMW